MRKLNGLQELRAVACLFVVLVHVTVCAGEYLNYNFMGGLFQSGYGGVDIFFTLSGFVVFYVHYNEIGKREGGLPFLIKKCLRIYPAYWIVLCILLVTYLIVPSFGNAEIRNPLYILESFLILPLRKMKYSALSVAWSLRYELLFYLMFSLLFFLKRKTAIIILSIWLTVSVVNLILTLTGTGTDNFDFNFLFSAYNLEFFLGMAAAYCALYMEGSKKLSLTVFAFGIGLFLVSMLVDAYGAVTLHRFLLYGIPGAFIIYGLASYELYYPLRYRKELIYLGNASYSIYLIHFPVVSMEYKLFTRLGLFKITGFFAGAMIIFIIAVICGCIFYELIEKKLGHLLKRIRIKERKLSGNTMQRTLY